MLLADEDKQSSQEKPVDNEYFKKLMESAHPTPNPGYIPYAKKGSYKQTVGSVAIEGEYELPKFLDTTTTNDGPGSGNHQNESSIAVSPIDPDFLIGSAVDYRDGSSTWIYLSYDGGLTWENRSLEKPFVTWRSTNDPSVHFDTEGNAYLMYGGFPGASASPSTDGQNGVFMSRSFDKGVTWETHLPVILHDQPMTPDSTFEDKYYIHIDNSPESPYEGNIYTPWKRVTPRDSATQIVFTRSEDKGDSWSEPVNISVRIPGSSEDTTFGQSFPLVTTDSKGNVYAIWNNGIEHGIGFNRSSDAGRTWDDQRIIHNYDIFGTTTLLSQGWRHTVKGVVRAEAYPVIEVNLAEGERKDDIYVVWAADNPPNIYFSRSEDLGDNWSDPIIIHETEDNDQWWPWLGVDPESGDIAVMYLDSRNDPENILTECYVSYSQDGGRSWIDRKASSAQFDVRNNPFTGQSFAGDYSGLDFRNGIIYPSWVDMRNEDDPQGWDSDVYTAIMDTRAPSPPDNFTTTTIPAEPDKVQLSWEPVLETTFGRIIEPSAIRYEIYRDTELVNILPSDITELTDITPEPFAEYDYTIRALYDGRTSAPREEIGFSGGAKEPLPPVIEAKSWNAEEYSITVDVPSLRRDSITPLVNAKAIELYLDGELYSTIDISPTDTAKSVELRGPVLEDGYYEAEAVIVADFTELGFGEQRSPFSNKVVFAVGSIDEYYFAEENPDSRLVIIDSAWNVNTTHITSAMQSLSIGLPDRYTRNTKAQILMPPVKIDDEPKYLHFNQILQIANNDNASVEISTDLRNWQLISEFSSSDKESWGDQEITSEDWRYETIRFDEPYSPGDIVFIRLLFESDNFLERGEWIVDNLQISNLLSSIEENEENSSLQYNAFYDRMSDNIIIINDTGINSTGNFSLYDIKGSIIARSRDIAIQSNSNTAVLKQSDLSSSTSGVYILVCEIDNQNYTFQITLLK